MDVRGHVFRVIANAFAIPSHKRRDFIREWKPGMVWGFEGPQVAGRFIRDEQRWYIILSVDCLTRGNRYLVSVQHRVNQELQRLQKEEVGAP